MTYLDDLSEAVADKTGCEAHFMRFERVAVASMGEIAWDGDVAVFGLVGHPTARRCYAWGTPTDDEATKRVITTIPEIAPVISAETAVRAALAAR
jgi:hypothetical protein